MGVWGKMKFTMPYGGVLEVRPSREIEEDVEMDEEKDGLTWEVWWMGRKVPLVFKTRYEAIVMAVGAQWGVKEGLRRG